MDLSASAEAFYDHIKNKEVNMGKLTEIYDNWCDSYDTNSRVEEYQAPHVGAVKLSELMADKGGRILDVGCGTGRVGEELHRLGFKNLDGIDISSKSIEVARSKKLYTKLDISDVKKCGLPYKDGTYNGLVSIGTFCRGHIDQSEFPEFLRVVKSGGIIMLVVREHYIFNTIPYKDGQLDLDIVMRAQNMDWEYICRDKVPYAWNGMGIMYVLRKL